MAEFASLTTTGQASRKIYDCQTQWNQHIDLVLEEGGPVNADQIVNNAYDFAGKTRDYFKEVLNRKSSKLSSL